MKTGTKSDCEVVVPSEPVPSEPLAKPHPSKNYYFAGFAALVLLVTVVAGMSGFLSHKTRTAQGSSSPSLHRSAISPRTIRITGATEAVRMSSIIAPTVAGQQLWTLTVTKLVANGSQVHKGEILAEFDRQAQLQTFVDKRAEYTDLANQALQAQAKEDAARAKDETEIQQAESALRKAQLEIQKRELLSQIDAEKAQQTLDGAKATFEQLRETFDLKRQAAHASIRLLEIQRDRAHEIMEHARTNAELMEIHSPIDGVVVLNNIWKQGNMGQVKEGDQVRAGMMFMQVVDPSRMQVRAAVSQQDFLSLQFGDAAKIHLDAYPDLVFPGKLEEMAPIARSGDFSSKLRTFIVVFSIEGSHARLMPDLSAAVDVNLTTQTARVGAFQ